MTRLSVHCVWLNWCFKKDEAEVGDLYPAAYLLETAGGQAVEGGGAYSARLRVRGANRDDPRESIVDMSLPLCSRTVFAGCFPFCVGDKEPRWQRWGSWDYRLCCERDVWIK